MGKVYTAVFYRAVSDEAALAAYTELARSAIVQAGGRVIARGLPLAIREGGAMQRTLIVEWDRLEDAVGLYEGAAYKAALARLGDGAVRDIRIIEAMD